MTKKPFVTKEKIEEIAKEIPTPFHLYDERGIRENAQAVKEAFAWNKGFREYFAVKANPNPFLINILERIRMRHGLLLPDGVDAVPRAGGKRGGDHVFLQRYTGGGVPLRG